MKTPLYLTILFGLCSLLIGCHGDYSPKQKAYPRVVYPEKKYTLFEPENCPFKFEIPTYSTVKKDTSFFGKKTENPCWMTVEFPNFNGSINLTYKDVPNKETFNKLIEDAHKLSYKHTKKANFIDEYVIKNPKGVEGMIFDVGGDAASNFQFYVTDKNKHFVRGSLYFFNEPNVDSMKPIIAFVRKDLDKMLNTFEWK